MQETDIFFSHVIMVLWGILHISISVDAIPNCLPFAPKIEM